MRTKRAQKWLDENGYIYTLDFLNFFKDETRLINKIKNIFKDIKTLEQSVTIILSKFDTYGSYELPNIIYLNIYQPLDKILDVFNHELKHLRVEKEVQKKGLTHKEKEDLINSLK